MAWWSRLFGPSDPPIDAELAKAIGVAQKFIALANSSLRAACDSLDCDEREAHQEMARMALFRLEFLTIMYPRLSLTELDAFKSDLDQISEATKARRREQWVSQKRR